MSSNITNILVPLLAGFSAKWYDDLSDNEKLGVFKNETLIEFLKGAHYICFTIMSINDPLWFIFFYILNIILCTSDSKAYKKPYEMSLFFSLGLLFILINYNNIKLLDLYEYIILIGLPCGFFIEPIIINVEYSIFKLIVRIFGFLIFLGLLFIFPNMSNTLSYTCLYFIGYCMLSILIQIYSIFIYKKEEVKNPTNTKEEIKNNIQTKEEVKKEL
jgi:hypothetical protein